MKIVAVEQRSEPWKRARRGIFTASFAPKIVGLRGRAPNKFLGLKEETLEYQSYLYKLVAERITGESMRDEKDERLARFDPWVKRGIEKEDEARAAFVAKHGINMEQAGFITTDDGRLGCSLDGLSPDHKTFIEIKVPAPWTFLRYKHKGHDDDYEMQVAMQLIVSGAEEAYFYAWHEYWPAYAPEPVKRNENYLAPIKKLLYDFVDRVDEAEAACRKMGCLPPMSDFEAA